MAESADFMEKFIANNPIPQETIDYFLSTPWIAPYVKHPLYEPISSFSRVLKPSGEDFFFSRTVNTPTTIRHLMIMRLRDITTPTVGSPHNLTVLRDHKTVTKVPEHPDTIMLLSIGNPGLDGHPSVVHGGMLCAILDEMMGVCIIYHMPRDAKGERQSSFTVKLDTTYRAAVPTPSNAVVRCWVTKIDGRKMYAHGQIVNEAGVVMTEAEGMFISTARRDPKI